LPPPPRISLKSAYTHFGVKKIVETLSAEREFFIDNLLVRVHFIIVMTMWTGLAPREFEFPFPGSLTSTGVPRS